MSVQIILSDDTTTATLQALEVPLSQDTIDNNVEVVTLDNNLSVYIVPGADKQVWSHTWRYMSEADYNTLRGFRDRQRVHFKYPLLTITALGFTDVPVYMTLNPKNIIDHCVTVKDVTAVFRESAQIGG